jgi:hypothetical protein
MNAPNNRRILSVPTLDDYVVTIDVGGDDQNFYANYWITSMYHSYIQLILNVNTPVYAYDLDMSVRVATNNVEQVVNLASYIESANANADLNVTPPTQELREQHAMAQMIRYGASGKLDDLTLIERTNAQMTLCQQFGVKNLAKLIATYENVNIRTIHERIQRLRKDPFAS